MDDRAVYAQSDLAYPASIPAVRPVATIRQVHRWLSNRLFPCDHEVRVMRLAVNLFRLLQPFHGLSPRHRRMLRVGALLHDIGRVHGSRRHHVRGQQMLLDGACPRLAPAERLFAAYAARHHRGRSPDFDADLAHFPSNQHHAMRTLLAILRAADALDKRTLTPPTIFLRRRGQTLTIELRIADQWRKSRRIFNRRRKFRMLEDHLDLTVRLAVLPL